jgi:hypothetical protein
VAPNLMRHYRIFNIAFEIVHSDSLVITPGVEYALEPDPPSEELHANSL